MALWDNDDEPKKGEELEGFDDVELPPSDEHLINNLRLDTVPKDKMTEETCLAAVKINGLDLIYVPQKLRTPEICLAAVRQNGAALNDVPKNLRTAQICLAAVKSPIMTSNNSPLKIIPPELITEEMCIEAVKQDEDAINYVPAKFKKSVINIKSIIPNNNTNTYTYDKWLKEIKGKKAENSFFNAMPQEYLTKEMWLAALSNPKLLLTRTIKTFQEKLSVLNYDANTIQEILMEAMKIGPIAVWCIETQYLNQELLDTVYNSKEIHNILKNDYKSRELFGKHYKITKEQISKLIDGMEWFVEFLPDEWKTGE